MASDDQWLLTAKFRSNRCCCLTSDSIHLASSSCRAIAIRFGVVRFVVHVQEYYTLAGPGGMFPQKKFRGYEARQQSFT